jgi:3',5'-cyclic AMP phosphodiesterase CpdA
VADTHIEPGKAANRTTLLAKGLRDMSKASVPADAFIIAGDMTESGTIPEYITLGATLKAFAKADNLLLEMGNHDIRGKRVDGEYSQNYEFAAGKYFEFLKRTAGITEDTIYFYRVINGCYFIVLNTEGVLGLQTVLSAEQLQWADDLLAEAALSGNPAFVINHQPISAVGAAAAQLNAILLKYSGVLDVFFISGHHHHGFSANTIKNEGTVYYVDMPSYGKAPGSGYNGLGSGFQVELYENEVIFRARNFVKGEWLTDYDRTITLLND